MKYTKKLENYWNEIKLDHNIFISRGGLASAIDDKNNCVYIYGGENYNYPGKYNQIYKIDLLTNEVYEIDSLDIVDRINHRMFLTNDQRIVIIGGWSSDFSIGMIDKTIIIYFYDIKTKKLERLDTKIDNRGQLAACIDNDKNKIYLFGGFEKSDFYCINYKTNEILELDTFSSTMRAGMIFDVLPNNEIFGFSGFYKEDNKSKCHNDLVFYNPDTKKVYSKELREPFGRTFSKHAIIENLDKILIYGGTVNGMEHSRYLYFYDYKKDFFNIARIQPLPGERIEPTIFYSRNLNKFYILGGFEIDGNGGYTAQENLIMLDIALLEENVWI